MKIAGILCGVAAAACAYNAIDNFRIVQSLRSYPAEVTASKLKVDYGFSAAESREQPLYTLVVDFVASDESKRSVHWEGMPGSALYPEEAFDEVARFAPGTKHNLSMPGINGRAVRIDSMEKNPEVFKGFVWGCCCFVLALVSWGFVLLHKSKKSGVWAAFVVIGMMPILATLPVGYFAYEKLTSWEYVSGKIIGERKAFDPLPPLPNVEFSAKALEKLPTVQYQSFEFEWNGKVLHGGYGGWFGAYDVASAQESPRFYVSPKDRWATEVSLDWKEDFWTPCGILLVFGVVFSGAGLLVKRTKL
jgi:hypothetical protein